jgi:hypothetical protein
MNFEVYCDESGLEALTRKDAHNFTAIGGIWMPAEFRANFKTDINAIKGKHNVKGELKWQKVSPAYLDLYIDVINYFFDKPELRFRVIIIESKTVDNIRFNEKDAELGFYKFYYQLLHHWIFDFNTYNIFIDYKVNRNKGRVNVLKKVLDASNIISDVQQVQALHSHESVGIQLADILTGLVASKFNNEFSSKAKGKLIEITEARLKNPITPTPKWVEKFNVFKINLQGGW